jgi:acetyl esterase/lipase
VLTTSPKPTFGPDAMAAIYAPGQDLKQPLLSPLFADFTKGFPPTFLQSGTRDMLLSDTVRMHRVLVKAGIDAELHVWEAMPHSGFGFFTPEDEEIRQQFLKFVDRHAG